jgi:hypothetical protein
MMRDFDPEDIDLVDKMGLRAADNDRLPTVEVGMNLTPTRFRPLARLRGSFSERRVSLDEEAPGFRRGPREREMRQRV